MATQTFKIGKYDTGGIFIGQVDSKIVKIFFYKGNTKKELIKMTERELIEITGETYHEGISYYIHKIMIWIKNKISF